MSYTPPATALQVRCNLQYPAPANMGEIVASDGQYYTVSNDGKVYVLDGEEFLPLDHNPFPLTTIYIRYLYLLPKYMAIATAVAAAILLVYFGCMFDSPVIQESFLSVIAQYGHMTSMTIILLVCLTFVGLSINIFARALSVQHTSKNTAQQYEQDTQDSICLVRNRIERDATIEERLRFALAQLADEQSNVRAVIVIRYADPVAYVYTSEGNDPRMDRNAPKWISLPDYKDTLFVAETFEQYEQYCKEFTIRIKEYLITKAHRAASNTQDAMANHFNLLKHTWIIALLLIAGTLSAQKSKQVETYLGNARYEIEKPVGKVQFVFSKGVIQRIGDGKFTYKELLPQSSYFKDDSNAGELISITVNGSRIFPVGKEPVTKEIISVSTPAQSTDPVRPRPLFPETGGIRPAPSAFAMIPDSATFAGNIEGLKQEYTQSSSKIKAFFGTIWNAIMWVFWSLSTFLLGALGFFRYIAKSAANESLVTVKGKTIAGKWIVDAQQNAAGFTLICAWCIIGFMLIDIFIAIVHFELSLWFTAVLWFAVLAFADKITDWLVPNLKVVKTKYE